MVLLKNNSGFPVAMPFPVGGLNCLNAKQGVKATKEEYERLKKEHPLVLKGLMSFNLAGASAGMKTPAVKKKSAVKIKTKSTGSGGSTIVDDGEAADKK